jgi:integrase
MAQRLMDGLVRDLESPEKGNRILYDEEVKGFGVRVTSAGAKAFVLNYRAGGRERRYTIGSYPDWKVSAARDRAKALKRQVDAGGDPMGDRHKERGAPTVAALADRYLEDYARSRKRPRSVKEDVSMIEQVVKPKLGSLRVENVRRADIAAVHKSVTSFAPIRANRVLSLVTKMFNLAITWELRADNPCTGIEKNHEDRRERYLKGAELARLTEALAAHRNQASANAIRLLLLTGARRGEVLNATWEQFDFEAGVWTKPASTTKQKKLHRIPLNAPALQLLSEMRAAANSSHLFPGRGGENAQGDIKRSWASICKGAQIEGLRVHDLRHSFASFLASAGLSLPIIGALLGHSVPSTTARYAHLLDDPLRAASEQVGAVVRGAGKKVPAEVVPLPGRPA